MRTRIAILALAALSLGCTVGVSAQQAEPSVPNPLAVTIDAQQISAPVSKYLYGSFIEHIGPLIYRSLWSELIDDRKFYFPITSKESEKPVNNAGRPFRMAPRKWRPVGPDGVVEMDADQPFVGAQSPRIALDATTPHGIQQSGLTLEKDKQYTGRMDLRGTPGSKVTVTQSWGVGTGDRQSL
mgnify:CR=1 FL=1